MPWSEQHPTETGFFWLKRGASEAEPCRVIEPSPGELRAVLLGVGSTPEHFPGVEAGAAMNTGYRFEHLSAGQQPVLWFGPVEPPPLA